MSVFSPVWEGHWDKIKQDWLSKVGGQDTVLICGDTSWALKFAAALSDLAEVDALPGRKVFVRGNHDFWWSGVAKMRAALGGNCFFLHNNFCDADGWALCGSRGWLTPGGENFTDEDGKIYRRELERAERSLSLAQKAGRENIILLLHYPPLYNDGAATGFSELCDRYRVRYCLYGHLHGKSIPLGYQGLRLNTFYHLVSADAAEFRLKRLRDNGRQFV
jgi:predicted phosphohydrolase